MKLPLIIRWGFDPNASEIPALATPTGRKFWAAVRVNHIVDQHFNDHVLAFAKRYDALQPDTWEKLRAIAGGHELHHFGSAGSGGAWIDARTPDAEWWDEMLLYLQGKLSIPETAPPPTLKP